VDIGLVPLGSSEIARKLGIQLYNKYFDKGYVIVDRDGDEDSKRAGVGPMRKSK
jgi:hypothetical protein